MITEQEPLTSQNEKNSTLDKTGKTVFDDIYISPDPRSYCTAMHALDYSIPEYALPEFQALFDQYQRYFHPSSLNVLDIGASYGINAALLCNGLSLTDFFSRYTQENVTAWPTEVLSARDQRDYSAQLTSTERRLPQLNFTGLDISLPALRYAKANGLLTNIVHADLETHEVTQLQAEILSKIDCIISTGCIGYISTTTLTKILDVCSPRLPWMAHCVLRMFPLDDLTVFFRTRGYHVEINPTPIPQRRFASKQEQFQVINRLKKHNIDTTGFESEGWLYAWVVKAIPQHLANNLATI